MASEFVIAVAKSTGQKQRIPRAWLDHPVLGKDFTLPASARAQSEDPNEAWKNDRIEAYATDHGIDLDGATKKADMLAAIAAHTPIPDADQADDKTPAAGDEKEN